jgi:hypothetical protein
MTTLLCLAAPIELEAREAPDGKRRAPRFEMVAYSGAAMRIPGFRYPVVVELGGVKIPSQNRPIRFNHDAGAGIGHTTLIRVENGQLVAAGIISRGTEAAREAVAAAENGFPWQASIGAIIDEQEIIAKGETVVVNGREFQGPILVVRKSTIGEISFVDAAADSNTSAMIAARGQTMNDFDSTTIPQSDPGAPQLAAAAAGDERDRQQGIRDVARKYPGIENVAIEAGLTVAQTRSLVRDRELDRAPELRFRSSGLELGRGDPGEMLTAAAMILGGHRDLAVRRFGAAVEHLPRPRGWAGLCDLALRSDGRDVARLDQDGLLRCAFSTSTLGSALAGTVQTVALDAFVDQSRNAMALARLVSALNFQPGKALRLASSTQLEKVGPAGEIKHGTLGADAFDFKIDTFARMLGITRQDLISDDVGILQDLPRILGAESARTLNDLFFSTLTNAGTFFSAGNNNLLTGTESVLAVASLSTAIKQLRTMSDSDGRVIGLRPRSLVVPAALEQTARGILNSQQLWRDGTADLQPSGNPLEGLNLELVVEPRLDAASATAWYVWADSSAGGMLAAFLGGVPGIKVEEQPQPFNLLGIQFRAYMDFGISMGEHRAIIKSDGA